MKQKPNIEIDGKTVRHVCNVGLAITFLSGCFSPHRSGLTPRPYDIEINPVIVKAVGRPFIDSLLASPRDSGSHGLIKGIDTLPTIFKQISIGHATDDGIIYASTDPEHLEEFRREFEQSKRHPAELVTIRGILAHEIGHEYVFPNTESRADSFALANLPEMNGLYKKWLVQYGQRR